MPNEVCERNYHRIVAGVLSLERRNVVLDNFCTKTEDRNSKETCKWNLISRNVLKTCKGTASIGEAKLFAICPDCGKKIELVSDKYDEETKDFLIKYEKVWVLLHKCNDCGLYYLPKLGHNCKN